VRIAVKGTEHHLPAALRTAQARYSRYSGPLAADQSQLESGGLLLCGGPSKPVDKERFEGRFYEGPGT
jgi:hypothetical protein